MTPETKTWLNDQHPWIQEAAESLLINGKIKQADIADFVSVIKTPTVVAPGTLPTLRTFPMIGAGAATTDHLHLVSIGDISGIDNLAPPRPLEFGEGNLAVVLGLNGSGKSGFTRILKKISGKSGAVDLKPNVYKPEPETRQCTIVYNLNDVETPKTWEANADPLDDLAPIDIFDSASGRVYLEAETEVSYKPAELALYSDLVDVCKEVDAELEKEQAALVASLPSIPSKFDETQTATFYTTLRATTSEVEIKERFEWTEDDEKNLGELKEKLRVNDPAKEASKQRAIKRQIDTLKKNVETALASVNLEACTKIKELANASKAARTAATEGAKALSDYSELDGVGSETWRVLWEAAREYSTKEAYADKAYPNVEDGARCVLCHQEIGPSAAPRLVAFEQYVSGALETAAKDAEKQLSDAIDGLPVSPSDEDLQTACQAACLTDETLESLKSVWAEVQRVSNELRANPLKNEIKGLNAADYTMVSELTDLSDAAQKRAVAYDKDAEEFDRTVATEKLLNLEAKRWASEQLDAIKAEVARLKKLDQYAVWRRQTSTAGISRKAGQLSKALITDAYVDRFNAELKNLGASHIKVELVRAGVAYGEVKHRIQLREVIAEETQITEILSEGERRIVSLAGFLADVNAQPSNVPFVFDDPISSLDHEYEWKVATRLVELAQTRQVIVFTHRLSLCGGLEAAAMKKGDKWARKNLSKSHIRKFGGTTGHPIDSSILNLDTARANQHLIRRVDEAKKSWDAGNTESYEKDVQGICSDFRKLIERTIEEDLLSKVVLRHRRSVTTEGRLPKLAKIEPKDCQYFDELMTKYSCYEHSQSDETPVELPDEPDLRADIEGLRGWRKFFKES